MFGQRDLAAVVALRHRPDLRHRLVAFVHEQQRVLGQIFEQCRRGFARQAPGEEAAVILDPRAAAGGGDHLEVEIGPLLEPLRFEQAAFLVQFLEPLGELELDRLGSLLHRRAGRHIVRIGIDAHLVEAGALLAGKRIEFADFLDIVAEKADPPRHVLIVAGKDFQAVAADAEIAAREGGVIALVLERDELADQLTLVDRFALLDVEDHRRIGFDRTDTVEARHRGDDDHVVAFEQRARGRVAHAVDRLVYAAFLLDIGVAARDVGFGLVIVVIADEIFDCILGEEALELAIELRGEDLVGREDQCGPLQFLDYLGHGEGLARPGHAQQHLRLVAVLGRAAQFGDRSRLVARGSILADQLERLAAHRFFGARRLVGDELAGGVRLVQSSSNDQFAHARTYGERHWRVQRCLPAAARLLALQPSIRREFPCAIPP